MKKLIQAVRFTINVGLIVLCLEYAALHTENKLKPKQAIRPSHEEIVKGIIYRDVQKVLAGKHIGFRI